MNVGAGDRRCNNYWHRTRLKKFHKAEQVTQQLASEVGMDEFQQRLPQMWLLRDTWAKSGTITPKTSDDVDTRILPLAGLYHWYSLMIDDTSTLMESSLDSSCANNPISDRETGNGERTSSPARIIVQ